MSTNSYPIDQFLIIDDSGDSAISECVIRKYGNIADIIVNDTNIGQRKSLDEIIKRCKNEYIFHLEEDWLFDSNSDYVFNSLQILKKRLDIHQVHIRHQWDDPHPPSGEMSNVDGIYFNFLDPNFRDEWNGFSFNPGLRRKSDILQMFPNGIQEFKDEKEASLHTRNFGYKAVRLIDTACKHIGYGRGTQNGDSGF
jgi:hypothetical protein